MSIRGPCHECNKTENMMQYNPNTALSSKLARGPHAFQKTLPNPRRNRGKSGN
ncbi:uncharacterized protein EI90DRAFT_3053084 [Cantharellus anzutake]|uniref:uncharacterized protein n=1 Tax=Cantharellus anzutake TaxID=1750568 RepID=UPI001903EA90|nr:uncharacterized protein EI90DRAFT_3053084 [Cantharellus anzutake]KAF8333124.1 hypothetical protein EI90DRAFT_3053084 [Cantharellus anzutake]